ncbi:hypothetical protein H696_01618 [Fonticula alba]|uniref:Uncharacterized protein n=1 Tax=Fonticula alba TaxID=691883 RepID=A0A058ZE68_FONAL|nr:hypothetical protein H696_01618 [Fonticula alba]KCV72218.1 hypothetical protein H696_01618 [Fonticula alba]|eukprot:XP_009493796.1 hypothetical protein H696_01618 [Fonticula alba]
MLQLYGQGVISVHEDVANSPLPPTWGDNSSGATAAATGSGPDCRSPSPTGSGAGASSADAGASASSARRHLYVSFTPDPNSVRFQRLASSLRLDLDQRRIAALMLVDAFFKLSEARREARIGMDFLLEPPAGARNHHQAGGPMLPAAASPEQHAAEATPAGAAAPAPTTAEAPGAATPGADAAQPRLPIIQHDVELPSGAVWTMDLGRFLRRHELALEYVKLYGTVSSFVRRCRSTSLSDETIREFMSDDVAAVHARGAAAPPTTPTGAPLETYFEIVGNEHDQYIIRRRK